MSMTQWYQTVGQWEEMEMLGNKNVELDYIVDQTIVILRLKDQNADLLHALRSIMIYNNEQNPDVSRIAREAIEQQVKGNGNG